METWDAIRARRNVRTYEARPIAAGNLHRILEAGWRSPSASNRSGHSAIGDQEACRRILGIPEDRICAYMLALGYPADRPLKPIAHPDRRPLDEVVHHDHW